MHDLLIHAYGHRWGVINFINQIEISIFTKLIIKARLGFIEVLPSLAEKPNLSDKYNRKETQKYEIKTGINISL
jgi:hypothetical protein